MREKLKYIIAILLIFSVALWFMPLVSISIVDLSLMDILKLGTNNYDSTGIIAMIYQSLYTYLKPYMPALAGGLAAILLGAFLTAVLSRLKAYIAALISLIVNNIVAAAICLQIKDKMDGVSAATVLMDFDKFFRFNKSAIAIWLLLYVVILILTVTGIKLCLPAEQSGEKGEIMPENFSNHQNPWKQQPALKETDYLSQIQQLERMQKKSGIHKKFYGALIGTAGIYSKKIYPLKEMTEVFFQWDEGQLMVTPYKEDLGALAGIYYVTKYHEYCIEVFKTKCFFLESGQPLGTGRRYYLPRGSRIYIKQRHNTFILA